MSVTFKQLVRILEYHKVQPDMDLCATIFRNTKPENVNVLVEDNTAYITEKK